MGTSVRRPHGPGAGREGRAPWEGHSRPEAGPPGGLVAVLAQWERRGRRWRVVSESDGWVTVGLMGDGGAVVSRVTGARTAVLTSFLGCADG